MLLTMSTISNKYKLNENLYEVARLDEDQLNNLKFDSEDDDLK